MKKSIYTVSLLVLVSFALTGCGAKTSTTSGTQTNESTQEQSVKGSFLDIIKLGKSVKCTYSSSNDSGVTSGETYVSGTKSRTDFILTLKDGTTNDSHSITDGEWIYIWTSTGEQGSKMKIADMQKSAASSSAPGSTPTTTENKDLTQPMDYKCSPWLPDNSKFTPPSNITFTDLTEMLNQLQNPSGQTPNMCGTCNLAGSAENIAQCKKSLGCE